MGFLLFSISRNSSQQLLYLETTTTIRGTTNNNSMTREGHHCNPQLDHPKPCPPSLLSKILQFSFPVELKTCSKGKTEDLSEKQQEPMLLLLS
jgi:hypothetical protein